MVKIENKILSSDNKNIKYIFTHSSSIPLEVSLIRKNDGKDIICLPTQTNCKMGCQFCHLTGVDSPTKNLEWREMATLVDKIFEDSPPIEPTLLISYMGAGEPLLNIENVIASMLAIQHWKSYYKNIKFAISTIIPNLFGFGYLAHNVKYHNLPVKLHWSMHATSFYTRKSLMPAAKENNVAINCLRAYKALTNQNVEIHYTLIDGINDTDEDINNIAKLILPQDGFNFKLLKFAPRADNPQKSSLNIVNFKKSLETLGYQVEVYSPPGEDIQAACGQFMLGNFVR